MIRTCSAKFSFLWICAVILVGCSPINGALRAQAVACLDRADGSKETASLVFQNVGLTKREVLWINPITGMAVNYFDLLEGESRRQSTFVGHFWVSTAVGESHATSHCVTQTDGAAVLR
jgi:hypothetical protein